VPLALGAYSKSETTALRYLRMPVTERGGMRRSADGVSLAERWKGTSELTAITSGVQKPKGPKWTAVSGAIRYTK
jgi:hypothetical protein